MFMYLRQPLSRPLPVFAFLLLFMPFAVRGQQPLSADPQPFAGHPTGQNSFAASSEAPVDLVVQVREPGGATLANDATVRLSMKSGGQLTAHTQEKSSATFSQIRAGEYDLQVSAEGYKTAKEHTVVFANGSFTTVYVYLHSQREVNSGAAGAAMPIMTPHLRSEVDKGLDALRKHHYETARVELARAVKLAPGNPDVQYLMGMLEYSQHHYDAARQKFQTALAIYPLHESALVALGELQLRSGDAIGATATLERAYATNGADWRTHFLLASAYFAQTNLSQALTHAKLAATMAKEQAASAWMLVGQIFVQMKKTEQAGDAFRKVIRNFPTDTAVNEAKAELAGLDHENAMNPGAQPLGAAAPSAPLAPPINLRTWAPPDVDSREYPVQDVSCSEDNVLARTQTRILRQLGNFEKFIATEHIEHERVDAYGVPQQSRARDFSYIVLLDHPGSDVSYLEERRDGDDGVSAFPTPLATQGLFALASNIFGPHFRNDLGFRCEGLGTWRGEAAWQVRFEQKPGVPAHLRLWRDGQVVYALPLKGRAWISASDYDVLHIETDLCHPVEGLHLMRDHLVIDYGPVKFEHDGTILWLPWNAEMFMELHGKRYHHIHTLRNYMLFSVDTTYTVGEPKPAAVPALAAASQQK